MEKQKNTELNFLYQDDENNKKAKKKRQKLKSKKSKRADETSAPECDTFNFDNEIVIGVTKIPNKNKTTNTNRNRKSKLGKRNKVSNNKRNEYDNEKNIKRQLVKHQKDKENYSVQRKNSISSNRKLIPDKDIYQTKMNNKKKMLIKACIKWTCLLGGLIAAIIFFMMSPLFNIVEVQVEGNQKLHSDTIISLSQITLGENIYKISSGKVENNIKQNAYIQEVNIKRKLPNKMIITVQERKPTYMIEYANSYAYLNNQGYILEISQEKLNLPIITGHITKEEDLIAGNRLENEDLEKLETVLKIVDSANSNGISEFITKINIQDKQNYTIIMEEKKKTVYLGDASNLSNRMIYVKAILVGEEGIEGEIFVNGNLNKENAFFRKKE